MKQRRPVSVSTAALAAALAIPVPAAAGQAWHRDVREQIRFEANGSYEIIETRDTTGDTPLEAWDVANQSFGYPGGHVCYAGRQHAEIRVQLPPGTRRPELPPDRDVKGGFAVCRSTYAWADGAVLAVRDFTLSAPHALCTDAQFEEMSGVFSAMRHDLAAAATLPASPAVRSALRDPKARTPHVRGRTDAAVPRRNPVRA